MNTTIIAIICAIICFVLGVLCGKSINKVRVESAELNESRLRKMVSNLEERVYSLEQRNMELEKNSNS